MKLHPLAVRVGGQFAVLRMSKKYPRSKDAACADIPVKSRTHWHTAAIMLTEEALRQEFDVSLRNPELTAVWCTDY